MDNTTQKNKDRCNSIEKTSLILSFQSTLSRYNGLGKLETQQCQNLKVKAEKKFKEIEDECDRK